MPKSIIAQCIWKNYIEQYMELSAFTALILKALNKRTLLEKKITSKWR